jgi:hypothetical protein
MKGRTTARVIDASVGGRPVVRIAVRSGMCESNKNPQRMSGCGLRSDLSDDHIMRVICPTCQI